MVDKFKANNNFNTTAQFLDNNMTSMVTDEDPSVAEYRVVVVTSLTLLVGVFQVNLFIPLRNLFNELLWLRVIVCKNRPPS